MEEADESTNEMLHIFAQLFMLIPNELSHSCFLSGFIKALVPTVLIGRHGLSAGKNMGNPIGDTQMGCRIS